MPEDILFDLNAFGERGVELAQLAGATEAAGRVETLTGSVSVRRLNGETLNLSEGDEIFMGDTLEVSNQGSVGVLFADDTTMALGEGAQLIIDEMVYDPAGEEGNLAVSVANGVFSFVSGQISKTGDEAMTINTPVATIGIRGTKGAGFAAPEGSRNTISLMQEDDGQTGEIIVRTQGGVQVLNQPGQTVALQSRFEPPPPPELLSAQAMEDMYRGALGVLPPPPRRRPPPLREDDPRNQGEDNQGVDGTAGEAQQTAEQIAAAKEAVTEVMTEAAADGVITEEEAAAIAEAMAETGAFGDSEEAVAAATEAYIAALESGATVEEAAEAALSTGQAVAVAEQAADAADAVVAEVAENVDGEGENTEGDNQSDTGGNEDETSQNSDAETVFAASSAGSEVVSGGEGTEDVVGGAGGDIFGGDVGGLGGDGAGGLGITGVTNPESILGETPIVSVQEQFAASEGQQETTNQKQDTSTNTNNTPTVTNITGTGAGEQLIGGNGIHNIEAGGGDDYVVGGSGNDTIKGEGGNDILYGDSPFKGQVSTNSSGVDFGGGASIDKNDYNFATGNEIVIGFTTDQGLDSNDTNGNDDAYLKNINTGAVTWISHRADGSASSATVSNVQVSGDGTYAFFISTATDLAVSSSNAGQLYRLHIANQTLEKVSETSLGVEGTSSVLNYSVSDDGNQIAFSTNAINLDANDSSGGTDIYLKTMSTKALTLVSKETSNMADGTLNSIQPTITGDGSHIVFTSAADSIVAGDGNNNQDIFKYKVSDGSVARVSVDTAGAEATGGNSYESNVSSDGRYVVFQSDATNLIGAGNDLNGVSDIFLRDTQLNTTVRVSVDNASGDSDGASHTPSVSDDGRYVVFHSTATDLLSGTDPTGASEDIFIRDMLTNETRLLSAPLAATAVSGTIDAAHISNNGHLILFSTTGSYVHGDTDAVQDVYMMANPFLVETAGGADTIDGGAGNDTIWGGAGDDILTGGTGADKFFFRAMGGHDKVLDFSSTDSDKLVFDGTTFGISSASFTSADFETIGVAYDGTTNTAATGKNVIVDSNGDVWVDNNGPENTGGYSVVANVTGDPVTFSDIEIVD